MLDVMSENLKLKFMTVTKKRSDVDFSMIEAESKNRWRRIIYYLLNIPTFGANHTEEEYFKSIHGPLL